MTTEFVKKRLLSHLMQAEFDTCDSVSGYPSDNAIIPISQLLECEPKITKYLMRKTLRELIVDGLIEYTSIGCPAMKIEEYGEFAGYREVFCEAKPPVNGYALTNAGFECAKSSFDSNERKIAIDVLTLIDKQSELKKGTDQHEY